MTKDKQKMKTKEESKNPVSIVTGEIIDGLDVAKENIAYIEEEIRQLTNNKNQIKRSVGLLNGKPVPQKRRFFYKMYKQEWNLFDDLSTPTFKVLKFFEVHMDYKSNTIMIDNRHLTYKEMSEFCKVGYTQFKRAIKELKLKGIIHTERKGKYTIVTMIPLYMEDSMTSEDVYKRCGIKKQ